MKKLLTALFTTMLMLCSCMCPLFVFAVDTSDPEFDIKNGVLIKYYGTDSNVNVPDGVTEIGAYAFYDKPINVYRSRIQSQESGNQRFQDRL